ncbi:MAG TPA: phosphotransferase [Acidimicrobiales bacterium]|nr:phosphotransferase [Acidimicrobiales bacterium]
MSDLPPDLLATLDELGVAVERTWREASRAYGAAVGSNGRLFFRHSDDLADHPRFDFEARIRLAIGGDGLLRAPAVLRRGPGWMVEQWVEREPCQGAAAMRAVADASLEVSGLVLPPRADAPTTGGNARRLRPSVFLTPFLLDALRMRRLLRSSALPRVTSHGDFHPNNVYWSAGSVWAFDWELATQAPLGVDALRFWCSMPDADDRAELFERLVEGVGRAHRPALLQLRYAVLVRTLAGARANRAAFDRDTALADRLTALLPAARREAVSRA